LAGLFSSYDSLGKLVYLHTCVTGMRCSACTPPIAMPSVSTSDLYRSDAMQMCGCWISVPWALAQVPSCPYSTESNDVVVSSEDQSLCGNHSPCSAELISTAYQPWNSVFLSQQNSHSRLISRRNSLPNRVIM
jgi:hypothetical protein